MKASKWNPTRSLRLALSFLTIFPVAGTTEPEEEDWRWVSAFFPLVGAFVGTFLLAADRVGRLPGEDWKAFSAALVMVVNFLLTGGMHHDGLADAADAFLGSRGRGERLRIMKDTSVGALGAASLSLYLISVWTLLNLLPSGPSWEGYRAASLVFFPAGGRAVTAYLCGRCPYAREKGMALGVVGCAGGGQLLVAVALNLFLATLLFWFLCSSVLAGTALTASLVLFAEVLARFLNSSLGGVTGDVLGAAGLLGEALALLLLAPGFIARLP